MPARLTQRVALIAWPAADWNIVSALLDAGALPHTERLIEGGVLAHLPTPYPDVAPSLYTSVITGKGAEQHGILTSAAPDPYSAELSTPHSTARQCKALWNILTQTGLRSLAINWPAQFPSESIQGVSVSPEFFALAGTPSPIAPGSIHPLRLAPAMSELRVHASELTGDDLLPFVPTLASIDQQQDTRVHLLARSLAEAISVHAVATACMESERWDFLAASYNLIENASIHFGRCSEGSAYREVLAAAYRFSDMMLGRVIELAGSDAAIILVSAQGFVPGEQPRFRPRGFFCLSGRGIRKDELVHGASLLDIAPTVLRMLGLASGRDMPGNQLVTALVQPPAPEFIATWETNPEEPVEDAASIDAIEELRALGYVDPRADQAVENRRRFEHERAFRMAILHLTSRRIDQAVGVLQQLLSDFPDDATAPLILAHCHLAAGQREECRLLLDRIAVTEQNAPVVAVLRSELCLADNQPREALTLLRQAEAARSSLPILAYAVGNGYRRLHEWRDAERAFARAAELHPGFWMAQEARALMLHKLGKTEESADAARASLELNFKASGSHYLLGLALMGLGEHSQALRAMERSMVVL